MATLRDTDWTTNTKDMVMRECVSISFNNQRSDIAKDLVEWLTEINDTQTKNGDPNFISAAQLNSFQRIGRSIHPCLEQLTVEYSLGELQSGSEFPLSAIRALLGLCEVGMRSGGEGVLLPVEIWFRVASMGQHGTKGDATHSGVDGANGDGNMYRRIINSLYDFLYGKFLLYCFIKISNNTMPDTFITTYPHYLSTAVDGHEYYLGDDNSNHVLSPLTKLGMGLHGFLKRFSEIKLLSSTTDHEDKQDTHSAGGVDDNDNNNNNDDDDDDGGGASSPNERAHALCIKLASDVEITTEHVLPELPSEYIGASLPNPSHCHSSSIVPNSIDDH
jgi:hypothetical protein